ncbi:Tar ligand binding domain-containing protein, partial [Kineococcus sp. GCM10028916]|uniref:Tar ligand binding domain-containing protein n=1 Tax=Kineococcus sp. GCM10028916 TaxID=3273394 RepID=UPI0036435B08
MKALRDLNVAPKLFAGFGVVCLLLAAVVALGISRLGSSQANLENVSTSGVASVQTLGEVRTSFLTLRMDIVNAAVTDDQQATEASLTKMGEDDTAYDQAWSAYQASNPATPAADRAQIEDLVKQYRAARVELATLVRSNDRAGFVARRSATTTPVTDQLLPLLADAAKHEKDAAAAMATAGSADYHAAVVMLLVIGAVALTIAVVVAVVIARSIARPLARTLTVVQGLADGRLDQRAGLDTRDEVGRLGAAVDVTMDRLNATMRRISDSAATLAGSSEELTTVATQLSSGAEES